METCRNFGPNLKPRVRLTFKNFLNKLEKVAESVRDLKKGIPRYLEIVREYRPEALLDPSTAK